MGGSSVIRLWHLIRPSAVAVALLVSSCGGGKTHPPVDAGPQVSDTLRAEVVAALATNVLYPEIQSFETIAATLDTAVAAYAAAPTDTALGDAARQAWRDAMEAWQRLELMQVGPLGYPATTVAGQGLREEIYSWPVVSRCGMDEHLVAQTYTPPATLAAEPVNVRGFAALEYLLFNTNTGNSCGSLNAINSTGTWNAIADLDVRRANYASSVATLIHQQATAIRQEWDPAGGNFLATISNAGMSGSVYPSAQEALNGISNGMFYIDLVTKSMKVAIPAGISASCGAESCPASVESALSDSSLLHIKTNLIAYRLLVTGGDGAALGFDDLLYSIDQGDLVALMLADIDAAIAAVDAVPGPLETAVVMNPLEVQALHDALKTMTDLLKGQFIGLLDLDRPMAAAGDND